MAHQYSFVTESFSGEAMTLHAWQHVILEPWISAETCCICPAGRIRDKIQNTALLELACQRQVSLIEYSHQVDPRTAQLGSSVRKFERSLQRTWLMNQVHVTSKSNGCMVQTPYCVDVQQTGSRSRVKMLKSVYSSHFSHALFHVEALENLQSF
jgi:hypothetical protein